MWTITETTFDPAHQNHRETIFTTGNGYLSTRGAFEEGYPGEQRATFVHGVFDDAPIVFTELANAPDWLPVQVLLDGERFNLADGRLEAYERQLDLSCGLLTRRVRWSSPQGRRAEIVFERFASLANPHLLALRCVVTPDFDGSLSFQAGLNLFMDNEGLAHWRLVDQALKNGAALLRARTRRTGIELALAMRCQAGGEDLPEFWDVRGCPTFAVTLPARRGQPIELVKWVGIATSRDGADAPGLALAALQEVDSFASALERQRQAWAQEWARCDVVVEGDEIAQQALRFSLYHLLIAAPRQDDRVNIGAKSLSGFGYRGHSFWDTETFMLPVFIFTSPHIARNLLNYRYQRLAAARARALAHGFEGAQFPWESADSGEEVTPTWVPHFSDPTRLVRIWTGDIEIHISADIAYAVHLYWKVTGDDDWFIERGAEIILDTAKFFASRAEWNPERQCYEYRDVIGPDEYHEHVDNNFFTNRMAQWNLQTALSVLDWLHRHAPHQASRLIERLDLNAERLEKWKDVIQRMFLPIGDDGLIEQFEGYFQRRDVNLAALEPRSVSAQVLFGIEGCNETQVLKQADVLMLLYLLRSEYSDAILRVNYDYYTPRTDLTYGSSLGPSIQAIAACETGKIEEAYQHFIQAARADLHDVRGNAGDGIHAASAGGIWQATVFGFAGLKVSDEGWTVSPRLPAHWKRLAFRFYYRGEPQCVDLRNER